MRPFQESRNSLPMINWWYCILLSEDLFFTFTNSVDPGEMQQYAAFHLGLQCLQKYSFRSLQVQRDCVTHCLPRIKWW